MRSFARELLLVPFVMAGCGGTSAGAAHDAGNSEPAMASPDGGSSRPPADGGTLRDAATACTETLSYNGPFSLALGNANDTSSVQGLVQTSTGYAVVFLTVNSEHVQYTSAAMLATLSPSGALESLNAVNLPAEVQGASTVSVAYNGTNLGMVFVVDTLKSGNSWFVPWFLEVGLDGKALGEPIRLLPSSTQISIWWQTVGIAWSGSEYLAALAVDNGFDAPRIALQPLDATGHPKGSSTHPKGVAKVQGTWGFPSNVVWTGSEFAVAWNDGSGNTGVAWLSPGGSIAREVQVSESTDHGQGSGASVEASIGLSLSYANQELAANWFDGAATKPETLESVVLAADGSQVGPEVSLGTYSNPFNAFVGFGGSSFLVSAGSDTTTVAPLERKSPSGGVLGSVVPFSSKGPVLPDGTLALWNGHGYILAWSDGTGVSSWYALVSACP